MILRLGMLGLLVSLSLPGAVLAQDYPIRPVRVVVSQSPGSAMEIFARIVSPKVSDMLGQNFVIDARGGAGGTIGVATAARAVPDGYTLLLGAGSSMIISTFSYKQLPYDVLKDFEAISMIVDFHAIMVVNPNLPVKSVKEFIALAKSQPGKLNMASGGIGSSSHLAGLLFTSLTGIESVHVPYKGGPPLTASVVAGETQWTIAAAAALMGQVRAGRLRPLAISSAKRSAIVPEWPTIAEAGVPGYEFSSWNGFFAPRGTPRRVITQLHAAVQKALADSEVRELYAAQGLEPQGSASPAEFDKFFRADFERYAKLVKMAGIKPE